MDAADLHDALLLREATYAVVHDRLAGRALAAVHLATINAVAARPDAVPRLTAGGELAFSADQPGPAALSRVVCHGPLRQPAARARSPPQATARSPT